MDFSFETPMDGEDEEKVVTSIIEEIRASGLQVPDWIVAKCRERVVQIRQTLHSGSLTLNLEVIGRQVADLDIVVVESDTT